jgi:hypothetical protein
MGVSLGYIPSKMWQLTGSRKSTESKSKWPVFSTLRDKLPRDEPSGATVDRREKSWLGDMCTVGQAL